MVCTSFPIPCYINVGSGKSLSMLNMYVVAIVVHNITLNAIFLGRVLNLLFTFLKRRFESTFHNFLGALPVGSSPFARVPLWLYAGCQNQMYIAENCLCDSDHFCKELGNFMLWARLLTTGCWMPLFAYRCAGPPPNVTYYVTRSVSSSVAFLLRGAFHYQDFSVANRGHYALSLCYST